MNFTQSILINHKDDINKNLKRLKLLKNLINDNVNLSFTQFALLYGAVLEFKPDLILEFGRAKGNSLAALLQGVYEIKNCSIESFCLSNYWQDVFKKIKPHVESDWHNCVNIHTIDLTKINFEPVVKNKKKILIWWDAHGYEVAQHIFSSLMPLLMDKQHLVLIHDAYDARCLNKQKDYNNLPIYKSEEDCYAGKCAFLRIGWITTACFEYISIIDFLSRNNTELKSLDYDLYQNNILLTSIFKDSFIDEIGITYFSMNEYTGPYYFPKK